MGAGDFIEDLQIHAPVSAETVTVEGILLYADGEPVEGEFVSFRAGQKGPDEQKDAGTQTDAQGRFSLKVLRGTQGRL